MSLYADNICPRCGTRNTFNFFPCINCGHVFNPSLPPSVARFMEEAALPARIIEAEAESLEEARARAKSLIPPGFRAHSEKIISDGSPTTVRAVADTTEEALAEAESKIPAGAVVLEKQVVTSPGQKVFATEAFDGPTARDQVSGQLGEAMEIKDVRLTASGKKGILGIGKAPNQYEVDVFQRAVAVITHSTKVKILVQLRVQKYEFRNPRFFSNRPLSELKGIILLAPEGEAEQIAKSQDFVITTEDTVGTWMHGINTRIVAIGHHETRELCRRAQQGDQTATEAIITTGIGTCLEKTLNIFPPAPAQNNKYIIRVIDTNELTGSCFLLIFVY
jgi:hypothetical protein